MRSIQEMGLIAHPDQEAKKIEHRRIDPDEFLEDNRSEKARHKVDLWIRNYELGNHYVLRDCADARNTFNGIYTTEESSIATGSRHKASFAPRYIDSRVKAVVNRTHFDGILSKPGERPIGCGGQDTSEKIRTGEIIPHEGATEYCKENVNEDPLLQSVFSAKEISKEMSKRLDGKIGRVFITTQDHRTGLVIPIGEYTISNGVEYRRLPVVLRDLIDNDHEDKLQQLYNPKELYSEGIPSVPVTELTPEFQEYLKLEEEKMLELNDRFKNFGDRQEIQDPKFFAISTNKIPFRVRMPKNFGGLGIAFKIHIPRSKTEQQINIEDSAINEAIDQLEYGVLHSTENHNKTGKSFATTHATFIDTGDLNQSIRIANRLMSKDWYRNWSNFENHQTFVAQSQGGHLLHVKDFSKI